MLLVSHDKRALELWSRTEGSPWTVESAGPGQTLALAAVGATLEVDALYRDPLNPGAFLA